MPVLAVKDEVADFTAERRTREPVGRAERFVRYQRLVLLALASLHAGSRLACPLGMGAPGRGAPPESRGRPIEHLAGLALAPHREARRA